ncbi:MAG: hypothetical protein IJB38_06765 [Bacteroidales bacterium]|nr:hypothetical protein [Bacteroidales bacterium]
MKKTLIYAILTLCISFLTMHDQKYIIPESGTTQSSYTEYTDYCISEFSHKQCPARPSNIAVPSIARTVQGNRSNESSSSFNHACRTDNSPARRFHIISRQKALLSSGYTDISAFFISLCKLII